MNIRSILRIIKFGFTNFWRNRWLSLAATLMMTITLLIISFFVILNLSVNTISKSINSRLDLEVFFFNDDIAETKILSLADDLKKQPNVKDVYFVTKSEAKVAFGNYEVDPSIIQIANELDVYPRSLRIKVDDPEKSTQVIDYVKQAKYSEIVCKELKCIPASSNENQKITDKLVGVTKFIRKIGWGIGILFTLVSIMIILNTIKLTMFTRKDEIEIMKLVGANHAFIRLPFVVESILIGLIASIISLLTLGLAIKFANPYMGKYLKIVNLDMTYLLREKLGLIIVLQLIISLMISMFCSFISIRKYLKS